MESNQRRLDGKPYLSGAFEAREILRRLSVPKETLKSLTIGGMKGIFIAPYFKRVYVEDLKHGIPLLGNNDILKADLSTASLLSKKVFNQYHSGLELKEGWTLITCFGTVGNMAYCREDMAKCAGSTNFMRVVPDPNNIYPGYLYAFLSSKFGVPLVTEHETGSVIPNLLPNHIADLPVPRLGDEIEAEVHELVEEAAKLRTEASVLLYSAIQKLEDTAGLPHLPRNYIHSEPDTSVASSRLLVSRLDGLFHSSYHKSALDPLMQLPESMRTTVGEMAKSIVEPTRFKRVQVDDAEHGIPFFGTASIMWVEPEPAYYIPKKMAGINEYVVTGKTVLIPRSGQLSGIIGHPVLPYGPMIGGAVSEHGIRVMADSEIIAGYLFIALVSEYGRRQLKSRAFGSSIPTLDINMIRQVIIPKLADQYIEEIGGAGWQTSQLRSKAIEREHQARKTVETAIEKGAASNL